MRQWTLIEDLKSIPTATIPVIKGSINLNKLRLEMGVQKPELPDSISQLKIDITFDDSSNKEEEIDKMLLETGAIPYDYNQSPHFYLAR